MKAAFRFAHSEGVTFEGVEGSGVEAFLEGIWGELVRGTYWPTRKRTKEIPKGKGKVRVLGIPTIRDRVAQGPVKLIVEPTFWADFQEGSYGYRAKHTAHQAVNRVARAVVENRTRVIDLDLKAPAPVLDPTEVAGNGNRDRAWVIEALSE